MRPAYLFLAIVLLFSCSSKTETSEVDITTALTDVVKLELEFGADETKTPDEYLLAKPSRSEVGNLSVNRNGDIYLVDEFYIKVYDSSGNPKKLMGGRGQGPGEFELKPTFLTLSPTGCFSAGVGSMYINVYDSNDEFIKKTLQPMGGISLDLHDMFLKIGFSLQHLMKIYAINPNERVFCASADDLKRGVDQKEYRILAYENTDTLVVIDSFVINGSIRYENGGGSRSPTYGDFHWDLLPDNKIVYVNALPYNEEKGEKPVYTLTFLNLDNFEKTDVDQPYNPVLIPDSDINFETRPNATEESRNNAQRIRNARKEWKYKASVIKLLADGKYVFVFTHQRNDQDELLVDVFDSETEKYVRSVFYSVYAAYPDVIKNGYAYRLWRNSEKFPVVQKYRIDPAVYGK
ncbi:hypothetical protein ACFL7D_09800 [candidate division KSB1 bacterium]